MAAKEGKFVRLFDNREVHITACAVTKYSVANSVLLTTSFNNYFKEPNQFWYRDPNHERALLKVYKRNPKDNLTCYDDSQVLKIPMPFLGHDSDDGWGELQFLIKQPAAVKLARHRSFDTRINQWVPETQLIQPKTNLGTHVYLALRFYNQDYFPPVPSDWRFESMYVSIRNSVFYKIDVWWEKEEITVTVTMLDKDSPEIPKHLPAGRQV